MSSQRGGKREGAGRKSIGSNRTINITLPDSEWAYIDGMIAEDHGPKNLAEYFRICHRHVRYDDPENWGNRGIEPVLDRETLARLRRMEETK